MAKRELAGVSLCLIGRELEFDLKIPLTAGSFGRPPRFARNERRRPGNCQSRFAGSTVSDRNAQVFEVLPVAGVASIPRGGELGKRELTILGGAT
jgi:hypothetical protein